MWPKWWFLYAQVTHFTVEMIKTEWEMHTRMDYDTEFSHCCKVSVSQVLHFKQTLLNAPYLQEMWLHGSRHCVSPFLWFGLWECVKYWNLIHKTLPLQNNDMSQALITACQLPVTDSENLCMIELEWDVHVHMSTMSSLVYKTPSFAEESIALRSVPHCKPLY